MVLEEILVTPRTCAPMITLKSIDHNNFNISIVQSRCTGHEHRIFDTFNPQLSRPRTESEQAKSARFLIPKKKFEKCQCRNPIKEPIPNKIKPDSRMHHFVIKFNSRALRLSSALFCLARATTYKLSDLTPRCTTSRAEYLGFCCGLLDSYTDPRFMQDDDWGSTYLRHLGAALWSTVDSSSLFFLNLIVFFWMPAKILCDTLISCPRIDVLALTSCAWFWCLYFCLV